MSNQNNKKIEAPEIDFHQAAVVNDKGEEIAITEEMVQRACVALDKEAFPDSENSKSS